MEVEESRTLATERIAPARGWSALGRLLRRRRFIVDSKFQGGLVVAFLIQLLIFTTFLAIGIFLPPIIALRTTTGSLEAARQLIALDARFWPAVAAAFVAVLLLAVRTSHKIAGPLFRFRRVFEALEDGRDPGHVRLRKGDFLIAEAEMLDRAVKSVAADRDRLADLERQARLLLDEIENDGGGEASRIRRMAERRLAHLVGRRVEA